MSPFTRPTANLSTMKTCDRCGVDFTPGSNRALYCSSECKAAAKRHRDHPPAPAPVGSRRDGFRVVIDGVEAVWRPRYLRDSAERDRLPHLDRTTDATEDLAGMGTFEGSRHGGTIRAVPMRDDEVRRWAIEERGVDIGAGL